MGNGNSFDLIEERSMKTKQEILNSVEQSSIDEIALLLMSKRVFYRLVQQEIEDHLKEKKYSKEKIKNIMELIKTYVNTKNENEKNALYNILKNIIEAEDDNIASLEKLGNYINVLSIFEPSKTVNFNGKMVCVIGSKNWLSKEKLKRSNNGRDLSKLGITAYISHEYDPDFFYSDISYLSTTYHFFDNEEVINILSFEDILKYASKDVNFDKCIKIKHTFECSIRVEKTHGFFNMQVK